MQNVKNNTIIFYLYFFLFYFSLFIQDWAISSDLISTLSNAIKIFSIIFMLISIFYKKIYRKNIKLFILKSIICCTLFIASRDLIWLVILLLSFCADDQEDINIIKTSYVCILFFTILTLLFCLIGVLPDLENIRHSTGQIRHSFGFYHSNVLPGVLVYCSAYYLIANYNKKILISFVIIFVLNILIYNLCNSKNAFFCCFLLLFGVFFLKYSKSKKINKIVEFTSKNIFLICFIISLLPTVFRAKAMYVDTLNYFDALFNNRIYLSALKYNIVGLHFTNFMTSDMFFKIGIVVDNAYVYTLLRYGILAGLLFILCGRNMAKKFDNKVIRFIIIVIAITNIVDNDLFSYGFLPFLIIGLKDLFDDVIVKGDVH